MRKIHLSCLYCILICIIFVGCSRKHSSVVSEIAITSPATSTPVAVFTPTATPTPDAISTPTSTPTPEIEKIITIGWEFEVSYDKENFDIPKTKVYLVIKGESNTREYIGEYIGTLENYDIINDNWGFPKDSILGCFGWYAGSGDLLSVVREELGTLTVKHKIIAESEGDPEIEKELNTYTFENIKSIPIDEEAQVQVIDPIVE